MIRTATEAGRWCSRHILPRSQHTAVSMMLRFERAQLHGGISPHRRCCGALTPGYVWLAGSSPHSPGAKCYRYFVADFSRLREAAGCVMPARVAFGRFGLQMGVIGNVVVGNVVVGNEWILNEAIGRGAKQLRSSVSI